MEGGRIDPRNAPLNEEGRRFGVLLDSMGQGDMRGRDQRVDGVSVQGQNERVAAKEPGLLSGLARGALDYLADPVNRKTLAIGLQGMSLNPDRGFQAALQSQIDDIQEKRATQRQTNQTVQFLRAANVPDKLLKAAGDNPELLQTLASAHIKDMYTAPTEKFLTVTGEFLNNTYGSNVPAGKLYRLNSLTQEITGIDGTTPESLDTTSIREYNFAVAQGYREPFSVWKATTGAGSDLPALSATEANATGFYNRMHKAHITLLDDALDGATLENQGTNFFSDVASDLPGGNYLVPEEYQIYAQAKRDFINANLRQESGAAISDSEFASANAQYFPMPGDGPAVIEQKRRNRETQIQSYQIMGGAGPSRLSITAQAVGSFVVMPDGRSILFDSPEDAQAAVARINKGT
jgi:hypothetical protein